VSELAPGDAVVVTIGRHRGSRAVVVAIHDVPTPTGGRVALVRIRRPRAGQSYLFVTDVRLAGEVEPEKRSVPAGFGS
jgi:ribosomal protein L14E/L6E/L27E